MVKKLPRRPAHRGKCHRPLWQQARDDQHHRAEACAAVLITYSSGDLCSRWWRRDYSRRKVADLWARLV